jgi:pilus assembly protein CpaF
MFEIQVKSKELLTTQTISGSRCIVGSSASSDIVLPGWKIQKEHAELFISNEQVFVRDLGSMFGTLVLGHKISTFGPLKPDQWVGIGGYELLVRWSRNGSQEMPRPLHEEKAGNSGEEEIISKKISQLRSLGVAASLDSRPSNAPSQAASFEDEVIVSVPATTQPKSSRSGQTGTASKAAAAHPQESKSTALSLAPKGGTPIRISVIDTERLALRRLLQDKLIASFDLRRIDIHKMDDAKLRDQAESSLRDILKTQDILSGIDREGLIAEVAHEAVGLGLLEPLLADPGVTEIMVNAFDEIFVERAGMLTRVPLAFSSEKSVMGIIERIVAPVGRRIDESSPLVDARLKDGSRFNAIIPPLALKGPSMTIRKFSTKKLNGEDLIRFNSASIAMVQFMEVAVLNKKNIIVSGGTGSGKTTLLNILSNFIPNNERIVTIEDAAELRLHHEHLVSLEARPANAEGKGAVLIRDLVKNSLRMRPDRIVVGECRGGEALDMLQAMNTGHDGSLTTAHANTPRDMLARLEVMVLMSGMDLPVQAIREQVASAVDIVVQQTRYACGTRKVSKICEVTGVESGRIQLQDIFEFVETGFTSDRKVDGYFTACGAIPEFYEKLQASGVDLDINIFQKEK